MNTLSREKQVAVIRTLMEGASVRSTERLTGVHRDTVLRTMVRVGDACAALSDEAMRDLPCSRVEVDEAWTFCGKKQGRLRRGESRAERGDFWIYVGFDPDSKAVAGYRVGKRTLPTTRAFLSDLAERLEGRIQLSADAFNHYATAVEDAFGGECDFGQIVKHYEAVPIGEGRYSPPRVVSVTKTPMVGGPDEALISTSGVERHNWSMRTSLRRMTRLSNGFSRKVRNLKAAIDVYMAAYNFTRIHGSIRATPAMALGVTETVWSVEDLVALAD